MSKYADIEQIEKVIRTEWIKYMPVELDMKIAFVLGKIAEVPTIKIVMCKDCKHFNNGDCTELPKIVSETDYCSYGERIEE